MSNTADRVVGAMMEFFELLSEHLPDARILHGDGVVAAVSGIRSAEHNFIWFERPNPPVSAVTKLIDEIVAQDLPFSLALRPGTADVFTQFATAHGMTNKEATSMMTIDSMPASKPQRSADGFEIRLLTPDEALVHARVCGTGFGSPAEATLRTINRGTLSMDSLRCYVGEMHGEPVATGIGITTGTCIVLMNITTLPDYRGRGFGAAITRQAMADGFETGAAWSWLHATTQGQPVWRGLGFTTIETWTNWVYAGTADQVRDTTSGGRQGAISA